MPRRTSRSKPANVPLAQPSITVESPLGAAIIHTDALLENIRRKQVRAVDTAPKWLSALTQQQRAKLQAHYRRTFTDIKAALKATDDDSRAAFAHFGLDALRTSGAFLTRFLFDKAVVGEPVAKPKKKAKTVKSKPQPVIKSFADLFYPVAAAKKKTAPVKNPPRKPEKKTA